MSRQDWYGLSDAAVDDLLSLFEEAYADEVERVVRPLVEVRREEDDSWSVSVRAMPGHVGAAMTLEEAFVEAADAAEAWVETVRT